MPSRTAAAINTAAVQELLNLVRLYGPNGYLNFDFRNGRPGGTGGPPGGLVAALEQLETAAVDPALLADGQTVASVEARTITDLGAFSGFVLDQLEAAYRAPGNNPGIRASASRAQYPTLAANLEADARLFTAGAAKPPFTVIDPPSPPASGVEQYLVSNTTTGVSGWENGRAYDGPVAALQNEFVDVTTDSINVTATKPNNFIRTGSGDDAIDVSLAIGLSVSRNVVDGGGGSNFMVSNVFNTSDIFLIDNRAATADTWNTVAGFHAGDAVTIYGVTPGWALDWQNSQGTAGAKGLTLHMTAPGRPAASLTLSGYTKSELGNGGVAASFGYDPAIQSGYLLIQGGVY